jgi:hypothetical protein
MKFGALRQSDFAQTTSRGSHSDLGDKLVYGIRVHDAYQHIIMFGATPVLCVREIGMSGYSYE